MNNSRPNILVIQADQLAANTIGTYQDILGYRFPKT